jgi:hypothetical protein
MKSIVLFLIYLMVLESKAQTNNCGDSAFLWNLERNNLFIEVIYHVADMDSTEISNQIYAVINSKTGITNVRKENSEIFFRIEGQMIDIKKYGYSRFNSWFGVLSPIDYNGRITLKNGKYRLAITGLVTHQSKDMIWYWDQDIFNQSGCLRGKIIHNALTVTRRFVFDEFNLNRTITKHTSDF